jgi:acyl-homoserine-lactone acylase
MNRPSSILVSLAACGLLAVAPASAQTLTSGEPAPVRHGEIIWDNYGIPHIYGKTVEDALFGYGYAQMKSHAELILRKTAWARGRLAEYFGPGANNAMANSDAEIRTFDIPRRAQSWLVQGTEEQRQYLAIFCAGMQAYLDRNGAAVDPAFKRVAPVTPADILALGQLTIHFNVMLEQSEVPTLRSRWRAAAPTSATPTQRPQQQRKSDNTRRPEDSNGSNGWALAPARSAAGGAILMGNPHLSWGANSPISDTGLYQWYEANLVIGDPERPALNASGVAFVGVPFIGIGYSDDIGWTHTNNLIKNADLYDITLSGSNSYVFDGQTLPLETRQDQIKVLQADGSFTIVPLTIASTVHGPIIDRRNDGHALALRVAGLDGASIVSEYWGMIRAHNLQEFIKANQTLQMPFFNVEFADRQGEIMYLFGGRQPVRNGGVFADYLGVLDGTASKTLWTRTLPWNDLPKTINPACGFVQNSNDGPWTSTFPQTISPAAYPAWIAPQRMELRAQHGATFLLSQAKFTTEEVNSGKESTKFLLAARILPDLLEAARSSGDATAQKAASALAAWDQTADADSKGGALFERWYEDYVNAPQTPHSPVFGAAFPAFKVEWSPDNPLKTPSGLADPAGAVPYLVTAANELQQQFGAIDVAWGKVHRDVLVTYDSAFTQPTVIANAPTSGGSSVFGPLRTSVGVAATGQRINAGGDAYIQVVEFDRQSGAKAMSMLAYGNSSRPASSHIADQLPIFDAKKLRPALRRRFDVLANMSEIEKY